MTATRYTDWTHIHVVGAEREAAEPYLPFARKLLGYVFYDAKFNNLGTHKAIRKLDDGTVVIAEKHGEIPRITIYPAPAAAQPKSEAGGDFVVWARNAAHPDGIDDEYPQQILRPGEEGWQVWTHDAGTAGRRTGIYSGTFPAGVRHAGNVDWVDSRGVRLSWYGPASRYFFDRWRQPSAQYGRFVFLLGQVLLDIDAYCEASEVDIVERKVLGAALNGGWLYVVQALMAEQADPPVAPTGRAGDVFMTPPYPSVAVGHRLVRYRIAIAAEQPVSSRYSVITGSHESLWSGANTGWVNPWFFNPDASVAETFTMPETAHIRRYQDVDDLYSYDLPSASSKHLVLTIEDGSATLTDSTVSIELNAGAASAAIAADYKANGDRVELQLCYEAFGSPPDYTDFNQDQIVYYAQWARYYLKLGETEIDLTGGSSGGADQAWAMLYTADLKQGIVVTLERKQQGGWDFDANLVIRRGAVILKNEVLASKNVVNGGPPYQVMWHSLAHFGGLSTCSPMSFLVGAVLFGHYGHPGGELIPPQGYYDDTGITLPYYLCARDQAYGVRVVYAPTDGTAVLSWETFADSGDTTYWNDKTDADDFTQPLALAADDNTVLYSGPGWYDGYDSGDLTGLNYATDGELAEITGIAGAENRYHPLWVLGELLRAS